MKQVLHLLLWLLLVLPTTKVGLVLVKSYTIIVQGKKKDYWNIDFDEKYNCKHKRKIEKLLDEVRIKLG